MVTCEVTKDQCQKWLNGPIAKNSCGDTHPDGSRPVESIVNRNGIYWRIKWVEGKTDDLNQYPELQRAEQVFPHVYQEKIPITRVEWNTEPPM